MRYGWTFEVIDGMDFDAIDSAWREGKPRRGIRVNSEEEVLAMRQDRRLWGHVR